MRTRPTNAIDRAAMALSRGLLLLGIVVLGAVEVLTGQPYGAAPLTNDAGQIVATPAVDPALRTGLVVLGFVVLLLWGLYRLAAPRIVGENDVAGEDPRQPDVRSD